MSSAIGDKAFGLKEEKKSVIASNSQAQPTNVTNKKLEKSDEGMLLIMMKFDLFILMF